MLSRASRGERDVIFGFFGKVLPAQGPLRGRAALVRTFGSISPSQTCATRRFRRVLAVRIMILGVHEENEEHDET